MKLRKHQKAVLELAERYVGVALLWPPGCGKSIGALAITLGGWKAKKVLILARPNNLETWKEEGKLYGTEITICHTREDYHKASKGDYSIVCSYDSIRRYLYFILLGGFDCLIADEGYQIQSPASRRHRATFRLAKRIGKVVLLNALPFSDQGYMSIFAQWRVMDLGATFGDSVTRFREKWQYEDFMGYGFKDRKKLFPLLIKRASKRASIITKEDCDLPQEIDKTYYVDWHPLQKKVYEVLRDKWSASFKNAEIEVDYTVAKICKLHQISGGIFRTAERVLRCPTRKLEQLASILYEIGKERVVIWSAYTPEIEMIVRYLKHLQYNVQSYTGKDKSFPQGWKILVAQIRMGVGINDLRDVPYSVYYSKYWSWYNYMQCRGRTARISSKHRRAFYFSIQLRESIDDLIEKNLKEKNSNAEQFAMLGKQMLGV